MSFRSEMRLPVSSEVSAGATVTPAASEADEPLCEDLDEHQDPEEDSKHFIAILIECLSLLKKIPEAVHVSRASVA